MPLTAYYKRSSTRRAHPLKPGLKRTCLRLFGVAWNRKRGVTRDVAKQTFFEVGCAFVAVLKRGAPFATTACNAISMSAKQGHLAPHAVTTTKTKSPSPKPELHFYTSGQRFPRETQINSNNRHRTFEPSNTLLSTTAAPTKEENLDAVQNRPSLPLAPRQPQSPLSLSNKAPRPYPP